MSFVGKVLIFVQVVLSICFMAFAGAVFATHQNWKAKYEQAQTSVQQAQGELNTARQQLETVRDEASRQVKAAEDRANEAEQRNVTLLAQVDQERRKNNRLEQELATQTGIARTKSDEAAFRQQEAEQQRVLNKSLHASLDEATTQLRTIQDELFSQKLAFEQLQARFNELLEEKAFLQQIVKLNNLETDPQAVAAMQEPAPPVEGLVEEVQRDKTNRTKYVQISIGSDDGLLVNHELDVFRIGPQSGNGRSQYLGKIRIIDVSPDKAVGLVIKSAKNGIIGVGDNVTTQL